MSWSAASGVVLTSGIRAYLDVLAARLGFAIVATSGVRDASRQAKAMLNKLKAKGSQELYDVYADDALIARLLAAPHTQSAWAKIIASEGQRLSRHLWNGAVDLRTRDLSSSQLAQLRAAVTATGGRPLTEYDHLHVDLPAKYVVTALAKTGAKTALVIWIVGGMALLTAAIVQRRRERRPPASLSPIPNPHHRRHRRRAHRRGRRYTVRVRAAGRRRRR